MSNPSPTFKFAKGDKRINRKGRPKDFLALRELAQQIAHEEVTQSSGAARTVTELILRKWAGSNDPRLQMQFIDVAFGKVPNPPGDLSVKLSAEISDKPKVLVYVPDNGRPNQ